MAVAHAHTCIPKTHTPTTKILHDRATHRVGHAPRPPPNGPPHRQDGPLGPALGVWPLGAQGLLLYDVYVDR